MTPRRLAALQALAARGATEGERAAARNALDTYRAEQAKQRTQQRTRPSHTKTEFVDWLFRTHDLTFREHYRHPQPPSPTEPRVTQMRRATAADFPELLTASADPSNPDVLVVELATAAQMWDRFNSEQSWRVLWQGFVWEAPKPCGTLHDRAKLRYYVKIDRRQLREVTVPA